MIRRHIIRHTVLGIFITYCFFVALATTVHSAAIKGLDEGSTVGYCKQIDFVGGNVALTKSGLNCTLTESVAGGGFDSTAVNTTTWGDGTNPSNTWTFDVATGDTTMTVGNNSIQFSGNVYFDSSVGIGTTNIVDSLTINNGMDLIHTATTTGDHAFEIEFDADGFGDNKAIDIVYDTGAISTGDDEGIILINVDQIDATGGEIFGLEMLATEGGSDALWGVKVGAGIGVFHQDAGAFANPTTGTDNTVSTDVPNMIDNNIATTTAIFENDNEYILIGAASVFQEIELIFDTVGSKDSQVTFGYSISGSHTYTTFSPVDGTNGLQNNGTISWDSGDLVSHVANDNTGTFDILITRTRNGTYTTPILGYARVVSVTEYTWDKNGKIIVPVVETDLLDASGAVDMDYGSADVTDHTFTTDGTGTAEVVLPAGSIDSTEILDATIAIADLASGTDGQLITWDASGNAAVVGVGTSTHVLTSNGAGAAPTFQASGAASDTNSVKDLYWSASSTEPLEVGDSVAPTVKEAGTNVDLLVADYNDSTDECRAVNFKVPSDVESGSTITFRAVWYSGTATTGNIIWDFRHTSGDTEGESWDSALTTETASADATQGTVDLLTVTTWTETLANTGWAADDDVQGFFCRDANNASDTLVGDARMKGVGVAIPRN